MRLGMMQPYFFPYLGYFALIAATDRWVVFDTAQYIRRGWVNRNRILSGGKSCWKYIRIPVTKTAQSAQIREIQLDTPALLKDSITRQLDEYRCWKPPFYRETTDLLDSCLDQVPRDLTTLLITCLSRTCDHLQLDFHPELFSELHVPVPEHPQPGDWALSTAVHLHASEYINPPGGRDLFDPLAFRRAGLKLSILQHHLPVYPQAHSEFTAGLSIIDALMWIGRDATRQMIADYQLNAATTVAA